MFVGGYDTSASWTPATTYKVGDIVNVGSYTYRCITAHTSPNATINGVATTFFDDKANWKLFVGNIRLKKIPYKVHDINTYPTSPEGDVQLDADFAVDGTTTAIRLTTPLAIGTKITVVKRMGSAWDSTLNIQYDDSKVAKFLKATPGIWYTDSKQISTSSATTTTSFDSTTTFDDANITFDQG